MLVFVLYVCACIITSSLAWVLDIVRSYFMFRRFRFYNLSSYRWRHKFDALNFVWDLFAFTHSRRSTAQITRVLGERGWTDACHAWSICLLHFCDFDGLNLFSWAFLWDRIRSWSISRMVWAMHSRNLYTVLRRIDGYSLLSMTWRGDILLNRCCLTWTCVLWYLSNSGLLSRSYRLLVTNGHLDLESFLRLQLRARLDFLDSWHFA